MHDVRGVAQQYDRGSNVFQGVLKLEGKTRVRGVDSVAVPQHPAAGRREGRAEGFGVQCAQTFRLGRGGAPHDG